MPKGKKLASAAEQMVMIGFSDLAGGDGGIPRVPDDLAPRSLDFRVLASPRGESECDLVTVRACLRHMGPYNGFDPDRVGASVAEHLGVYLERRQILVHVGRLGSPLVDISLVPGKPKLLAAFRRAVLAVMAATDCEEDPEFAEDESLGSARLWWD